MNSKSPTPAASPSPDGVVELNESQLDDVRGGIIALLLPAVQKVREAAARHSCGANVALGDGSVRIVGS